MSDVRIEPLFVTVADTRRLLSIGKTMCNDLANAGLLERQHVGGRALITMSNIEQFIAGLKNKTNS